MFLSKAKDKEDISTQEEKSASFSIEDRECSINTRSFPTTETTRAVKKKDKTGAGNAIFR
jgi:hypothetical protein